MKTVFCSDLNDMSEDLVVSIYDENNDIEQEQLLLGKVGDFWSGRVLTMKMNLSSNKYQKVIWPGWTT